MRPKAPMNCSVLMRRRTFSWATRSAPALPMFSFPPVWSPCQWVFTTKRTGSGVMLADRGTILSVSGAYWSSIRKVPLLPDGEADVSPGAGQHVDTLGHFLGLDLDFREVLLGEGGRGGEPETGGELGVHFGSLRKGQS